jgi:pimeloyl-ACP methyl ester carboxylesterase
MAVVSKTIKTSHADIAVSETGGKGLPILLLHGNSNRKEIFQHQMNGEMGDALRLVAMDLPGHGASSDAVDPARTYNIPGYADAVIETLEQMGIRQFAAFGWSLGGHVLLEMIPRNVGMVGLMITGTPPVGRTPEEIQSGFKATPAIMLAGKPDLTPEEVEVFGIAATGAPLDPSVREAIIRTDGRARGMMFASLFTGQGEDERVIAETSQVPLAMVNGADDPLVNVDYIDSIAYRSLWDKHCYRLRGVGHAPFMQAPQTFNAIFSRFVAEMAKIAAKTPVGNKVAAA